MKVGFVVPEDHVDKRTERVGTPYPPKYKQKKVGF